MQKIVLQFIENDHNSLFFIDKNKFEKANFQIVKQSRTRLSQSSTNSGWEGGFQKYPFGGPKRRLRQFLALLHVHFHLFINFFCFPEY